MASEEIGEAARLLVPALRRLSSRKVGRPLRRAVRHLDRALIDAGARDEALLEAASELRSFLSAVRLEEDSEPYEDVARVLAMLAGHHAEPDSPSSTSTSNETALLMEARPAATPSPSMGERSIVPEPAGVSPVAEAVDALAPPTLAEAVPSTASTKHSRSRASIDSHMSALELLYSRRQFAVTEPATTWAALVATDQRLDRLVRASRWIARQAARQLLTSQRNGAAAPTRFAATSILLASGDEEACNLVLRALLAAEHADGELLALRCSGDRVSSDKIASLLGGVDNAAVRAGVVSILGDRQWVRPPLLLELLEDPDDEVAIRAAEMVVWFDLPMQLRARIEPLAAISSQSPARRGALLFAAAALGSAHALQEVRTAVDAGAEVTLHHVHALAAVGGAADADRLASLACGRTTVSSVAALAVGHLGSAAALRRLERCSTAAVVEHATHAIFGSSSMAGEKGRRLLRGELWSVARALECLGDPDELLLVRYWRALDLAVRTGGAGGAVLDRAAPIRLQDVTVGRLRGSASSRDISALAGRWSWAGEGRPHPG